mmetsp:Transcript_6639/g.13512  ORF Transcript_6639/g.13512 Transcript_6639/m.13512 type:complete len:146 (-) Transcript_6639:403-840(-)
MPGKLFPTRALLAVRPYPHCNTFELVSPPLQSGPGLGEVSSVPHELQYFTASGLLQVNRSMGFHVHIDVSHWSLPQLVKVCQPFVNKYEAAMDATLASDRQCGIASLFFNPTPRRYESVATGHVGDSLTALAGVLNPGDDHHRRR